ncbi:cytochrome P450 4c21-like [Lutzomyia longipalpis]|uniref:cytochrome P450 4c21-like n=1 Tax=Lutzomyia longipalpis TaxID=7200 RepID=UPI0024833F20|nr:cytochrome P450 4c21-like [Lutzomyia longipalpis]
MWIILLFVILLIYILTCKLLAMRDMFRLMWTMPGLSIFSLIKNVRLVGVSNESILKFVQNIAEPYTTPFQCWVAGTMYVIVKEPEDLKIVLNSQNCLNRGDVYEFVKSVFGNSLGTLPSEIKLFFCENLLKLIYLVISFLFNSGDKWRIHRKLINPTFNSTIIQTFLPIFNKEIKVLVSQFENLCNEGNQENPMDIYPYMNALTLDTILQTTMGKEMNIQMKENQKFSQITNKVTAVIAKRMFNPLLYWTPIYRLTKLYKIEKECTDEITDTISKVLDEKKAAFVSSALGIDNNNNDIYPQKTSQVFIDQIMKLLMVDKKINEEDVVGATSSIVAGGFETIALTSSYCILMLAMHPEHQQRIYEEIISVGSRKVDEISFDDLNNYDFLDRFIKEVLRLFSPLPFIVRTATEAFNLGKYSIPSGTNIVCPIYLIHRNKEIWGPNPEDFNPDHFLPENFAKIHPYAYIPFSIGPRNCIGMKYAMTFLKTNLIHLVSNFKFRTNLKMSDLRCQFTITLNLANKHMVYIEKRDV